jgi:hypothetical protein
MSLLRKTDLCRLLALPVLLLILVSAPLAVETAAAEGALRAVLVGVSNYNNHPELSLKGPANDVALLKTTLLERGFPAGNIVVLADLPGANGRPTREAILRELDGLAEEARRDDLILVLFAGHGSQQPNNNPDQDPELDGQDEIFLPANAGFYIDEVGTQTVSGAIVDDEIGARLGAVRGKGAFVVFLSDSCHSEASTRAGASVLQGVPVKERGRDVKPEQLVRPEQLGSWRQRIEEAKARATGSRGGDQERAPVEAAAAAGGDVGGFVAFYAAQATETAPEMPLGENESWYGLFTYNLAGVLASSPGITYRQAFDQVLQSYRAINRFAPTPIAEGPDLDRLVFGAAGGAAVRQWPIASDGGTATIPVGRLHQIAEGTILAVTPTATTVDEAAFLGYARVFKAEMLRSSIVPFEDEGRRPTPDPIPAGAFARVVDARFETKLAVGLAAPPAGPPAAEAPAWRELDRLRAEGLEDKNVKLEWVAGDAPTANLRLLVRDGRLWFLEPSGDLVTEGPAQTPGLTISDPAAGEEVLVRFRKDLEANLRKVAKVRTLFALAEALAGNEVARGLAIELTVERAGSGRKETFKPSDVPELRDRDVLTLRASNTGRRPVDLTVLFVDSRYGVEPWFPYGGELNRVRPGETVKSELVVNLDTVGTEHFLVIAAAVEPGTARTDFSFLAQEGVTTRDRRGPVSQATVADLLLNAGLRGGGHRAIELAGATSFSWKVVPRAKP